MSESRFVGETSVAESNRLTSITYPNGRVIGYYYASGTDDAISRLSSIADGATTLESYTYLGQAIVVTRAHAESGVDLSYIKLTGEADGVNQARTHNAQNQLTQVGASNLAFDANGNLTTDQNGKTLRYDAWNRLVEQKNGATSEIAYSHDGLGRRITEGPAEIYFTTNWQAIEERNASNQTTIQYVWSPVYIDAMILRDRDTNPGAPGLDERLYVAQDANWNVTALISTSGAILERFQYDAYGKRSVLDGSWNATTDAYSFQHGHQGGKIDAVTGRINFRNRDYDVDLMRWIQQDYIGGYINGLNLYQAFYSSPLSILDPHGTECSSQTCSPFMLCGNTPLTNKILRDVCKQMFDKTPLLNVCNEIVGQLGGKSCNSLYAFCQHIARHPGDFGKNHYKVCMALWAGAGCK